MRELVESLRRLYQETKRINKYKVIELCNNGKITEEEKLYILNK